MPPQGNRAEAQLVHDSTVPIVGLPNAVSPDHFSGQQNIQSIDLHPVGAMEESAYATLSEMAISTVEMILPVQIDENEILRRGHSTENSFAGSITAISTSRSFLLDRQACIHRNSYIYYFKNIVEWTSQITRDLVDRLFSCQKEISFWRLCKRPLSRRQFKVVARRGVQPWMEREAIF